MLMDALTQSSRNYVVLDALDECTDRADLLSFIHSLVTSSRHRVHLLATSRRERYFEEELKDVAHHVIDIQSTQVDRDIAIYVRDRLSSDTRLRKWPAAVKDEITHELMSKANGMFRWAYCELESLRGCVRLKTLREALDSLPKTLDETYTRIVNQLESEGHLPDTTIIMQWLCFASRPLRLSEVVEILAIRNGECGGFDPDQRLPDPEDITAICSSLISCRPIQTVDERDEDESHIDSHGADQILNGNAQSHRHIEVRLAHFSVQEYLLSDRSCLQTHLIPFQCDDSIAEGCLRYLLHVGKEAPLNATFDYPLITYAAQNWWLHARDAGNATSATTVKLMEELFASETTLLSWIRYYDPDQPRKLMDTSRTVAEVAPPLYYACLLGLFKLVDSLLERGVNLNARGGGFGTALISASQGGHEQVVERLIAAGADLDAIGPSDDTALAEASAQGHEQVVEKLLAAGADVNMHNMSGLTALIGASESIHTQIVERLLAAGADVNIGANASVSMGGTALLAASACNAIKVVELLLAARADVNAHNAYCGSALVVASLHGHKHIVEILIAAGADVSLRDWFNRTAVGAAKERGHEQVVELLLAAGAEENPKPDQPELCS